MMKRKTGLRPLTPPCSYRRHDCDAARQSERRVRAGSTPRNRPFSRARRTDETATAAGRNAAAARRHHNNSRRRGRRRLRHSRAFTLFPYRGRKSGARRAARPRRPPRNSGWRSPASPNELKSYPRPPRTSRARSNPGRRARRTEHVGRARHGYSARRSTPRRCRSSSRRRTQGQKPDDITF